MPVKLVVVQRDVDGNDPHCLDTKAKRKDGEQPVVCYDLINKTTHKLYPTFQHYWVDYLKMYAGGS
jgi:hypothetical protein